MITRNFMEKLTSNRSVRLLNNEKLLHSLNEAVFLYKIRLTEAEELVICELKGIAEESFRAAPNAVDLVKRGAHKVAAGGEKKIEVVRLANAEGDKYNADKYPKILESAGAVGLHIVAHDRIAVNSERKKYCRRNNARAVLALSAMPKHRAVILQENIKKLAECFKRGLGGYHRAVGVGEICARAAFDLHNFFEDRGSRMPCDGGILLVC